MATIDDVFKALEASENKDELKAVIDGLKAEISKKNSEAKNLRDRFKQSEESGKTIKESLEKLMSLEGIEAGEDDDLDSIFEEHYTKKKTKETDDPDGNQRKMVELTTQMTKLTREVEKFRKAAEDAGKRADSERALRISADRDRQIIDALSKNKAISPAKLAKIVSGSVKMLDDESFAYVTESGDEVSLEEGIADFLKNNPEFSANEQRGGSGSNPKGGGHGVYSREQLSAMSPAELNKLFESGELSETLKNL